jgi:hypothetical protein
MISEAVGGVAVGKLRPMVGHAATVVSGRLATGTGNRLTTFIDSSGHT